MNTDNFKIKKKDGNQLIFEMIIDIKVQQTLILDFICNKLSTGEEDFSIMMDYLREREQKIRDKLIDDIFKDNAIVDINELFPEK